MGSKWIRNEPLSPVCFPESSKVFASLDFQLRIFLQWRRLIRWISPVDFESFQFASFFFLPWRHFQWNVWECVGFGRCDPVHREGWVRLPGNDCQPPTVQPPLAQEGSTHSLIPEVTLTANSGMTNVNMTNAFSTLNHGLFPLLQVLIIGGGDGGVLREVVKNSQVESVVLCEIDEVCSAVDSSFLSVAPLL